ncbi:hypothetical protein U9M48_003561, partial [Paspalum notatum var. saurae]
DVLETIAVMNQRQRQAVVRKGFSDILDMTLDVIGSRSHLCWLMDKLDPKDITIRPGPVKELKITKETVRLILGIPCAGGRKPLGVDATAAADRLRSTLGLTKDEFTVAKLQDRLRLVLAPKNYDKYFHYDISMLHRRTYLLLRSPPCCCSPQNKFDMPRTKYFDRNIIKALTRADKRKSWQGDEPFGHCDFRSATDTCYASARENHGLRTSPGRAATRHEATSGCHGPSAPAPESHAPQPSPSITKDCHADADDMRHCDVSLTSSSHNFQSSTDTCHASPSEFRDRVNISIHFPRIKDMLSSKIQQLSALERPKFEAKLAAHDQAVEEQIATIKHCLTMIVDKQFDLKDTFNEMIDDVLRAEEANNDETPQPSNDHDHAAQEPCTDSGTQLTPETQLDTPVTGTQVEKIYERQQHMRRSFETCPDDSDTEPPVHMDRTAQQNATVQTNLEDDALAAANELMTNLNIAAQGISERTSTNPPADPGLPKFDVTPQIKASLSLGSQSANCSSLSNEFKPKSMQYWRQRGNSASNLINFYQGSFVPPTTPIANIGKPTRTECALAFREFLCTRDVEINGIVMDFGGYISTCHDVKESFVDGKSLDIVFMQYFIECVHFDDSANLPSSNTSRFILDTNVGIMVPILRGGHWSLYVVNTVMRCVDILDSNSYGPGCFHIAILRSGHVT